MKKVVLIAMILAVTAVPAMAYTVEWKTKSLTGAGNVYFTSSFHASDGETINIMITNTAATISDVELVKATPKPKVSSAYIDNKSISGQSATVDVHFMGKKTLHLWVYLSTGEHIGVNVKAG